MKEYWIWYINLRVCERENTVSEGGPSVLLYRNLEDSRSEGKKGLHMSYNICYNTTFTGGLIGSPGAHPTPTPPPLCDQNFLKNI